MSEPAFPSEYNHPNDGYESYHGLTKLEYFAGQAMQGICANSTALDELARETENDPTKISFHLAKSSILMAKELIKQLEGK